MRKICLEYCSKGNAETLTIIVDSEEVPKQISVALSDFDVGKCKVFRIRSEGWLSRFYKYRCSKKRDNVCTFDLIS